MLDYFMGLVNDPLVGGAVGTAAILALADFATGVLSAVRLGNFHWDYVAGWVQSHLAGRVLPIIFIIILAPFATPLVAVAGVALAAYVAETLASIRRNLLLPSDDGAAG